MNYEEWNEVFAQKGIKNDKNPYNYYFHVYERKTIELTGALIEEEQ